MVIAGDEPGARRTWCRALRRVARYARHQSSDPDDDSAADSDRVRSLRLSLVQWPCLVWAWARDMPENRESGSDEQT